MNPLHLLRCPCCAARLIKSTWRRYETLVEHGTDPNGYFGDPGPRSTLVCSWENCPTHTVGAYWALDGEGPFVNQIVNTIQWIDGLDEPIGSWWRGRKAATRSKRAVQHRSDDFSP